MGSTTRRAVHLPRASWMTALTLPIVFFASRAPARAQATTTLVSANQSGLAGDNGSYSPSMSRDGRFVAFSSLATDLVANDTNFTPDVFVRDRTTGQTIMASVDSGGAQGDSISWYPGMSGDGHVVAFTSFSTNLVPGDTNGWIDVFVHDLVSGQTTRASVSSSGAESNASAGNVGLSFDGRYVVFDCDASNLVPNDTNSMPDIFVHDNQTGTTVRVSVDSNGVESNGLSRNPSISADGRFVCFQSAGSNLVPADANGAEDVFVHDMLTGQTVRASVDSVGLEGQLDSGYPQISGDGNWVVFESLAPNLVAGDTNAFEDVFVHDLVTGQTTMASVDTTGAPGNGSSDAPSISNDGRVVSFWSSANDLVPGGTTTPIHVYRRDLQLGVTSLASADSSGNEGDDSSLFSAISGDGRVVAFESNATNLVANDANFAQDIFAHDVGGPPLTPFCFGDGSGTACPCGNNSPVGAGFGCMSSLGTGAVLVASGIASVFGDSMSLQGSQMPNSAALFIQGTTLQSGGAGIVFGDGLRCAGGQVVRLATRTNVAGTSTFPGAGDPTVSMRGGCHAGDSRTYQVWYRNAAPFCTASTFNLSNGVHTTWTP